MSNARSYGQAPDVYPERYAVHLAALVYPLIVARDRTLPLVFLVRWLNGWQAKWEHGYLEIAQRVGGENAISTYLVGTPEVVQGMIHEHRPEMFACTNSRWCMLGADHEGECMRAATGDLVPSEAEAQ